MKSKPKNLDTSKMPVNQNKKLKLPKEATATPLPMARE